MRHERRSGIARAEARDILFDTASRAAMQAGIDKLTDAVAITLGPRGKHDVSRSLTPYWWSGSLCSTSSSEFDFCLRI